MLIIAGHFGTLYSYATVAGRVAEALLARGLLAGCQNFDDSWHPRWHHLRGPLVSPTHTLVVAAPNHYMAGYAEMFGRDRSAIFVSPNTDRFDDEHAETISKFGLAIAPSRFCASPVASQCTVNSLVVLPLGSPVRRGAKSKPITEDVHAVHFTSDQAWPSRKGTEALLKAWSCRRPAPGARLTVHGPPSLRKQALYAIRDLEIDETVEYVPSAPLGTSDDEMAALFDQADLIVAPSRCEGFGMMMLGALVAGVPLLTTCNTGHAEYLIKRPGAWLPIPTPDVAPLAYEFGMAPAVNFETLAEALSLALTPFARDFMKKADLGYDEETRHHNWGTWERALVLWTERLSEWMQETA